MTELLAGTGLQVIVAGRDVTARVTDQLQFSAVDPGGYETCQFSLPDGEVPIRKGDTVMVFAGHADVWWGRVEEPGANTRAGRVGYSVQAVGAGAALKDDPFACVYVDRDLSNWKDIPLSYRVTLVSGGYSTGQTSPASDQDGSPALSMVRQAPWAAPGISEMGWYDAGPLCNLARVYYEFAVISGASASNQVWIYGVDGDSASTSGDTSGNINASSGSGYFAPSTRHRKLVLEWFFSGANTGSNQEEIQWRKLAVYGDHGLPLRGADPGGFYPSDIARHAFKMGGILPGVIVDSTGYVLAHSVYREPTLPEQVVDDMGKLLGWHWGVWGPASVLDDRPRGHFRPPPPEATASCSRLLTEGFQLADQLSATYDSVIVAWQDAAGTRNYETVTQPNSTLPDGMHRAGQVDIGTSTQAGARAFGRYWLLLTQRAQRSGGQCTLPADVLTPSGARRRSLTLKPGLDRLRFTDLPSDGQSVLEADTRRFDTFRLKRTETTVEQGGVARTRVEFDTGADLISTMQDRLDAATQLATGR